MLKIDDLPQEMLLMIHRRLPPYALKMAVRVNKLWRTVGYDPALWKKFTVTVYSKEDITNLSIKKLQGIEEISINPDNWDAEDWEAFFHAVMGLSKLKKIDGLDVDGVKLVDPSLFAKSLTKLEVVAVSGCTGDHIQELFSEMSISTEIKKLGLSFCHLSHLVPELFGKVLSRLEDLILASNDTTKDQMEALFTEILSNRTLKRLDLDEDSWRLLKPDFFARVLTKVEQVILADNENEVPSDDHLVALFIELSFGSQLKKLELRGSNLLEMEPALVAQALSKLEAVGLLDVGISSDQVQALFMAISHQTQMKKLDLYYVDLSQLDAKLFGRVLVKLEEVELCNNDITADQMVAFFTEMSRDSNLMALYISHGDLSPVDPEVLVKAVTRLEKVILGSTHITSDQARSLFSEMSQNILMKKIDIANTDLSSVEPEDFARALTKLEDVSLCECNITHDQAIALFREMSQNTQLKKLELEVDLTTVDPEVLTTALTKVKEVSLYGSTLSQDQIDSILTSVLESENKLKKLDLRRIGAVAHVDPEIVSKVKEKLKGEFEIDSTVEMDNRDISGLMDQLDLVDEFQ